MLNYRMSACADKAFMQNIWDALMIDDRDMCSNVIERWELLLLCGCIAFAGRQPSRCVGLNSECARACVCSKLKGPLAVEESEAVIVVLSPDSIQDKVIA